MSPPQRSLRARVMATLLPAIIGGSLGYLYAQKKFPPEILAESSLPAMYAAAGAAMSILGVRLAGLLRLILGELRDRRRND
jgi:hypothetical protein